MCPHCNKNTFTLWSKFRLTPFKPGVCMACGATARPVWMPFIISMVLGQLVSFCFGFLAVWFTIMILGDTYFVILFIALIVGALIPIPIWAKVHYILVPLIVTEQ